MNRISLPVPDPSVQEQFGKIASGIAIVAAETLAAGETVSTLFSTLLSRAFSGQLTAKWREAHMQELLAEMREQARLLDLPVPESAASAT